MRTRRWIQQLQHPRRGPRLEAVRRLGVDPSAALLPALTPCLEDRSLRVRLEVIELLGRIGGEAVGDLLTARLGGTRGEERLALRAALQGVASAEEALQASYLEELAQAKGRRRSLAMDQVCALGDRPSARRVLRTICGDADDVLKLRAIAQLIAWGEDVESTGALALLDHPRSGVRLLGVEVIGANVSAELRARMTAIVLASEASQTAQIKLLAGMRSFAPLLEWLETAYWEQRIYLARVLAEAGVEAAVVPLVEGLRAADGVGHRWLDLRRAFVRALGTLASAEAIEAIKEALGDRDETVRKIAARQLTRLEIPFTHPPKVETRRAWPRPYSSAGVDPGLWEALVADDPAAWVAHAAWLEAQGDPRATLVREQVELTDDYELSAPHSLIAAEYGFARTSEAGIRPTWLRGYWHTFGSWSCSRSEAEWDAIFSDPSALFVRDFSVRWIQPELLLRLFEHYRPPLRRWYWQEDDPPIALDPFFRALPYLRDLSLWRAGRFDEGPRGLTTLSLNTSLGSGLGEDLARHARSGGFSSLEVLEIAAGRRGATPWIAEILQGASGLRTLQVAGGVCGEVLRRLPEWPGFATLEHLELEGFWPKRGELERLAAALEAREVPLKRYVSTGGVPTRSIVDRIRGAVVKAKIGG